MVYKIAIDGPAGSGKSTTAGLLRKKLGFITINSGNIYRSVAYIVGKKYPKYDLDDKEVMKFINNLDLRMVKDAIYYDNEDITPYLRTEEIDKECAIVAKELYIRKKVGDLQKKFIENSDVGIIIEGRDIGTNILPDATLKVYLDASPEIRAERRFTERPSVSYDDTLESITRRDLEDRTRKHGPLVKPKDAFVLLNDFLSTDEVVECIYNEFVAKIKQNKS
jgi:CMP/dCMP kinase